jgi:magnesium-transporting ATPase (P-type)
MVMITGDYGLTAESMARRVGILTTEHPHILTGAELDEIEDVELQAMLNEEIIFARMAPEHKLRLVAAYQSQGEVVAVIGDGVNDAPALRKADIGIAMGLSGTDVAKEAADMVLINDKFSGVITAIEEGRAIYDNLRKFVTYIFASNVPEIIPFVAMALFKIPLALTVPQILAIDLGTDLLPALGLGVERPEPNVMRQPPRSRVKSLFDKELILRSFLWLGMIETILCYLAFYYVFYSHGYDPMLFPRVDWLPFSGRVLTPEGRLYILATTVFHAGVILAQIGNAYACRTEKGHVRHLGWIRNRTLLAGVAVALAVILSLIYIDPLAQLFEHLPLPPVYWVGLASFAPIVYILDWIRREIARWIDTWHRRDYQEEANSVTL